jgi:RNA polymerase sigma-70 factor (ECF subfamily)
MHERDFFEQVVRECAGRLLRALRAMGCDQATAEDIIQETLLKAVRLFRAGRFDRVEKVCEFLIRVAINIRLRQLQRLRRQNVGPLPPNPPAPVPPPITREERIAALLECVALLPEIYKDVIVLQLAGLSVEQTARVLGISVEAVKPRRLRAREHLKECLLQKGVTVE